MTGAEAAAAPRPSAPPASVPVIRTIAMPADTNPAGDVFGGWLMAQMDLAAGNAAARRRQATNRHCEAGVRVSMLRPRFRWSSASAAPPSMRA